MRDPEYEKLVLKVVGTTLFWLALKWLLLFLINRDWKKMLESMED